ncbi:transposase [Rickettsia endosymbiont of Ixodes scapularis]|nr:transposase [Rickettsia endosymbiont of Ixodes scapularis]
MVVASFRFKIKHQIRKDTSNFTYFFDAVYHVLQKVTTLSA